MGSAERTPPSVPGSLLEHSLINVKEHCHVLLQWFQGLSPGRLNCSEVLGFLAISFLVLLVWRRVQWEGLLMNSIS